jgi:hypothetical protein
VANRARRSVGGGVLINIIKLAVMVYCIRRATAEFEVQSLRF